MFIWRLSKFRDLSGRGGLVASGRWHTRPKPIIYCGAEAHTAYLEILRQIGLADLLPSDYVMLKIYVPETVGVIEVAAAALDPGWSDPVTGWQICRPVGDLWFEDGQSALLKVPSAAHCGHTNYLINTVVRASDDIELADVVAQPFPAIVTEPCS